MEFGKKTGRFTPAFSINFLPAENTGHVKVEMDMEIDDNPNRMHRCCFYVETELGQAERFGNGLKHLADGEIGTEIRLHKIMI